MANATLPADPSPERRSHTAPAPGRVYGLMAEFNTPAEIMAAAERVRDAGYRWWDCHTPFPVHGLDRAMGIRATILPVLVFFGGLTGTLSGVFVQWFTNATDFDFWLLVPVRGYEFFVSGKPMMSLPAFIPVIFELTILLSALTAFAGMLLLNGLPRLYHPIFKSHRFGRASDDKFFLVIEAKDPTFNRSRTEELLKSLSPEHIEVLED